MGEVLENSMRKAIVFGLAVLFVVASQVPSQAAGRVRGARVFNGGRPGILARIAEFERAKNQWLFGR